MKKRTFLQGYMENYMKPEDEQLDPIFLDETWTFQNGTGKTKDWQNEDRRSCSLRKGSCEARYIVAHAGGKDGFVEGASLFFRSEKKPKEGDDYHGDMNAENFENWFRNDFVPNLKKPSLIILDNAPYHSVQVCV